MIARNNWLAITNAAQQELFKQVRIIAETASTNRARWLAAADAFRMPYFDVGLGAKAGELPDFFTSPHIQVTGPNGVPNVIPNPLFQYDFQPVFRQDFTDKVGQFFNRVDLLLI